MCKLNVAKLRGKPKTHKITVASHRNPTKNLKKNQKHRVVRKIQIVCRMEIVLSKPHNSFELIERIANKSMMTPL